MVLVDVQVARASDVQLEAPVLPELLEHVIEEAEPRFRMRLGFAVEIDRDIIARVVAAGQDPSALRVSDIATKDLVTIGPDQDTQEARRLLAQHQLDRLLVVEQGDRLVGIISEADLRRDEGPLA